LGLDVEFAAPCAELPHRSAAQALQYLRKRGMVGLQKSGEGAQRVARIALFACIEFALETVAEHSSMVRARLRVYKDRGMDLPRIPLCQRRPVVDLDWGNLSGRELCVFLGDLCASASKWIAPGTVNSHPREGLR